jgi:hypothetical protein
MLRDHQQPHLWGDETKPWERQWGETARQFAAFCRYRDLGRGRSLDKAFQLDLDNRQKNSEGARVPGQWALWSASLDFHATPLSS